MLKVTHKEATELLEKILEKQKAPWTTVDVKVLGLDVDDTILQTLYCIGFVDFLAGTGHVSITGHGFEYLLGD